MMEQFEYHIIYRLYDELSLGVVIFRFRKNTYPTTLLMIAWSPTVNVWDMKFFHCFSERASHETPMLSSNKTKDVQIENFIYQGNQQAVISDIALRCISALQDLTIVLNKHILLKAGLKNVNMIGIRYKETREIGDWIFRSSTVTFWQRKVFRHVFAHLSIPV